MTKKIFFISLCATSLTFLMGWELIRMASQDKTVIQAIPVIRFERFDKSRNALVIGLFNPGGKAIEINHTELFYKTENTITQHAFNKQSSTNKLLVLDPGDTILISMQTNTTVKPRRKVGSYWGKMDFKVSGQVDFFSLQHKFSPALYTADYKVKE